MIEVGWQQHALPNLTAQENHPEFVLAARIQKWHRNRVAHVEVPKTVHIKTDELFEEMRMDLGQVHSRNEVYPPLI